MVEEGRRDDKQEMEKIKEENRKGIEKEWTRKRTGTGYKEWQGRSCTRTNRMIRGIYKKQRRGKVSRKKYIEKRKALKEHLESKRRETKEEEEELRNLKNEKEIWKYINRRRGKRKNDDDE